MDVGRNAELTSEYLAIEAERNNCRQRKPEANKPRSPVTDGTGVVVDFTVANAIGRNEFTFRGGNKYQTKAPVANSC